MTSPHLTRTALATVAVLALLAACPPPHPQAAPTRDTYVRPTIGRTQP